MLLLICVDIKAVDHKCIAASCWRAASSNEIAARNTATCKIATLKSKNREPSNLHITQKEGEMKRMKKKGVRVSLNQSVNWADASLPAPPPPFSCFWGFCCAPSTAFWFGRCDAGGMLLDTRDRPGLLGCGEFRNWQAMPDSSVRKWMHSASSTEPGSFSDWAQVDRCAQVGGRLRISVRQDAMEFPLVLNYRVAHRSALDEGKRRKITMRRLSETRRPRFFPALVASLLPSLARQSSISSFR